MATDTDIKSGVSYSTDLTLKTLTLILREDCPLVPWGKSCDLMGCGISSHGLCITECGEDLPRILRMNMGDALAYTNSHGVV